MAQNGSLLRLQIACASAFGLRFGWRVSDAFFTIDQLSRGVRNVDGVDDDWPVRFAGHADFFVFPNGVPAAVTGHQYDLNQKATSAWAKARGLRVAFPDFSSWWNPPSTRLVVYYATRRLSE